MSKRQPPVVPPKYYDSIGHLASLGADRIERLAAFSANEAINLDAEEISDRISASLATSSNVAQSIIVLLMSLNDLRTDRSQSPGDLIDDLTRALAEQPPQEWRTKHLDQWKTVSRKLEPLLAPNGFFSLFRKAYELALNHPTVVASLQILSDTRPLYDENAENIRAMVLSHVLALRIQEGQDMRLLHITLDAGDVRKLRSELERAERKEAVLAQRTSEWGLPLLQLDSGK